MSEDGINKLLAAFAEVIDASAELARQVKVERKMVETLFAASYGMNWPTAEMLNTLRAAYIAVRDGAPDIEKPIIDQHIARIDDLLEIDKMGPKATIH